jgi:hypothetical protein
MKKKIRIDFSDFWGGFDKTNNYFYNLLIEEFDVEISNNPDYLFFSVFGNQHQNYKCKKIFYTGENVAPPLGYCDYSFSFDYLDDARNYRLPHYLLYDGYYELVRPKIIDESFAKRKFCSFVVSNGNCKDRNDFFLELSKYKKIDSAGRHFNNVGYLANDKIEFLKNYKFNICFENDAHRGYNKHYTTEKLMQTFVSNTVGIYLGNTEIEKEFNKKSFINLRDYSSIEEVIEYIIYLDKNDDKYLEILNQSCFNDYNIPDNNKLENIKSFLYKIFN